MRTLTPIALLLALTACGDITLRTVETVTCDDYVPDLDEDGFYAEAATPWCSNESIPPGWVRKDSLEGQSWDCEDGDPDIHPEADEHCDGIDENCNLQIDEDPVDGTGWYPDEDGDGYGNPDAEVIACAPDIGFVPDDRDCDDLDPHINPDAWEICNALDDDCNELVDDDPLDEGIVAWRDADGDGWVVDESLTQCAHLDLPEGWSEWDGESAWDCDDGDPEVYPGAGCPAECDVLARDDFGRADDDSVGTAMVPVEDWVESRGDIDLDSGAAIMSRDSSVNARILLDQGAPWRGEDLRIRFSFDIGNGLGVLWVMANAGTDHLRDGIGLDLRGPANDVNYDRIALYAGGTEVSAIERSGLLAGTRYYAEVEVDGDLASVTLATGTYASEGGTITHTLAPARVDRTPDGQQLKVAIDHNGNTSPRLESIEVLGGEDCR